MRKTRGVVSHSADADSPFGFKPLRSIQVMPEGVENLTCGPGYRTETRKEEHHDDDKNTVARSKLAGFRCVAISPKSISANGVEPDRGCSIGANHSARLLAGLRRELLFGDRQRNNVPTWRWYPETQCTCGTWGTGHGIVDVWIRNQQSGRYSIWSATGDAHHRELQACSQDLHIGGQVEQMKGKWTCWFSERLALWK